MESAGQQFVEAIVRVGEEIAGEEAGEPGSNLDRGKKEGTGQPLNTGWPGKQCEGLNKYYSNMFGCKGKTVSIYSFLK